MSERSVGRISQYRRVLMNMKSRGVTYVYSHELAKKARVSAAQVRRDLMDVGYMGNPHLGYETQELVNSIGKFLDDPYGQNVVLVGVGNLGRAFLSLFAGGSTSLSVVAAFDTDVEIEQVIDGCHCYPIGDVYKIVHEYGVDVGVIAVPTSEAQEAAERLVQAGILSLVNCTSVILQVPDYVHVETVDLTVFLERAAYYARERKAANLERKRA